MPAADLVERTLREHPPAPFDLWRFTRCPVELDGRELPARAPVLVDLRRPRGSAAGGLLLMSVR